MCKHRWIIARDMSRARCVWCGILVERAGPDPDGRWHNKMPVAMKAAMRRIKYPSNTQPAPSLA